MHKAASRPPTTCARSAVFDASILSPSKLHGARHDAGMMPRDASSMNVSARAVLTKRALAQHRSRWPARKKTAAFTACPSSAAATHTASTRRPTPPSACSSTSSRSPASSHDARRRPARLLRHWTEFDEGDCSHGFSGLRGTRAHIAPARARLERMHCVARCARCRWVSFSAKNRDCSWFFECAKGPTVNGGSSEFVSGDAFESYRSRRVRARRPATLTRTSARASGSTLAARRV